MTECHTQKQTCIPFGAESSLLLFPSGEPVLYTSPRHHFVFRALSALLLFWMNVIQINLQQSPQFILLNTLCKKGGPLHWGLWPIHLIFQWNDRQHHIPGLWSKLTFHLSFQVKQIHFRHVREPAVRAKITNSYNKQTNKGYFKFLL